MIISFILGVVVMSCFAASALIALDDDKEKLAVLLAGPAMWFWEIVCGGCYYIYKQIRLSYFRRYYLMIQIHTPKSSDLAEIFYIKENLLDFFYQQGEGHDDYCVVLHGTCEKAKSLPYKSSIITKHGATTKVENNILIKCVRPYTALYQTLLKEN